MLIPKITKNIQIFTMCIFYDEKLWMKIINNTKIIKNNYSVIIGAKGIITIKIDRYELRSSLEAIVNKVSIRLDNEPVPTGQRAIGARLLSPLGNR